MEKQTNIIKLLKENREDLLNGEKSNGICYDGIVNENFYTDIVVLLKETNGRDFNGKTKTD